MVTVDTGGFYVDTLNALAAAVTNDALKTVAGGANGVYGPVGAFSTQSFQNSNYFRDVVCQPQ